MDAVLEEDQNSDDLAEIEKWENCHDKIPKLLQPKYARAIGDFNLNTRIRIYKILDVLEWQFGTCELVLNVMHHAQADENIRALLTILELLDSASLYNILCIFINIDYSKVREFMYDISHEDILKLLDVVSFIDKNEFDLVYDFIQKLSVQEVIDILDRCNEPFAKQCRLCKAVRLASLEYRLLHNQLKPDSVTLSFLMVTMDTPVALRLCVYRLTDSYLEWSLPIVCQQFGKAMLIKNLLLLLRRGWYFGERNKLIL